MSTPPACGNCATGLRRDVWFCPRCGRPVRTLVPPGIQVSTDLSPGNGSAERERTPGSEAPPDYVPTSIQPAAAPAEPASAKPAQAEPAPAEPAPEPALNTARFRDGGPLRPPPASGGSTGSLAEPLPRRPSARPPVVLTALVILMAFVVLGGSAVIALKLLSHNPASNAGPVHPGVSTGLSSSVVVTTSPSTALSSSTLLPPQQQAASALAALLAESGTDRTAIGQAVSAAEGCSDLKQDEMVFKNADSSRQSLLADLATLPGGSSLPAGMLHHLTLAWQESSQADQYYARWAHHATTGCRPGSYASDPYFKASAGPALKATADKEAFVSQWSSIASKYGLPKYQSDQI